MSGQLKLWTLLCFLGLWITQGIHAEDFELKFLSHGSASGVLAFSVESQSSEKQVIGAPEFVSQVFILRLRPGNALDLARDLQKVEGNFSNSSYPSFSPDGRHLAFSAEKDGRRQIFIMDYPEGKVIQVTACAFKCENVAWDAKFGAVVFYVEDAEGVSARLARLGSVLKRQAPVAQAEFEYVGAARGRNTTPIVSEDGQTLYYSTNRFWPGWDICSLVLKSGREDCFLKGWSSYCRPKLFPSGQFLAYSGGVSDRIGIYKYDFKTKTSSKLLDLDGKDYDVSFIDDQRFFFSLQNGKKKFGLYQFQGPSHEVVEILNSKYSVRFPSYASL